MYLITPLGVYQKTVGLMIYKTKVLMICNSYGIDDIQGFALIALQNYDIILLDKLEFVAQKNTAVVYPTSLA